MSLREKAIKGVVWSGVQNWGSSLISSAVFVVLARLLQPEVFGLVALALAFAGFMEIFLRQGFAQALIQRDDLEPGHLDTAFWITVLMGAVLTVVGIAVAGLVGTLFNEPDLTPVIRWYSLTLLIGALSNTQQAILQRRLAFRSLAIRSLVAAVAGGVVGITMALRGFGVWSLVGQALTIGLVGAVVLWTASDWRPGFNVSRRHFQELFSFGAYVMGLGGLTFLNRRADTLLIGYFLGPVKLGYYNIAQRLLQVMTQVLTQTVSSVALPIFSRLQHDAGQMRSAFYTVTRMTSVIAFPAFLGMLVLAPELVRGLFGTRWEESIPVMRVLALMGILHSVTFFSGTALMASGKPSWRLAIGMVNSLVNVTALMLVVRLGIVWVATAFVVRAYLLSPLSLLALRKLIHVEPITYLRQFTAPLIGSLGMVLIVLGAKRLLLDLTALHFALPLCILIGIVVYSLGILLIAPSLAREVLELLRVAVPPGRRK